MTSLRRKMIRAQARAGRINPKEFAESFRPMDVDAKNDEVNAPIRRRVWAMRRRLTEIPTHTSLPVVLSTQFTQSKIPAEARRIMNDLKQIRLRSVTYRPTKGWRNENSQRPVEPQP